MKRGALIFALGLAACGGEAAAPTIVQFAASPVTVDPGGTAVLQYSVQGAAIVRIEIEGGALVLPPTMVQQGEVTTPPITTATTFVLVALKDGMMTSRSLTVRVKGQNGGAAVVLTFAADPATVESGGTTTLSWTTDKAIEGTIRKGMETIYEIPAGDVASGQYSVRNITAPSLFTLAVKAEDGIETTAEVTVVLTGGGPMIPQFTAYPNPITRGDPSTLSWTVVDATSISITGNQTGTIYSGTDLDSSAVVMPRFNELYTLVAVGADNRMAVATEDLRVNAPPGADILLFTATPSMVFTGMEVMLAWQVNNAPGGIEIEAAGATLTTTTAMTGMYAVHPFETTTYTLHAYNQSLGDARTTVTVMVGLAPGARILEYSADRTTVDLGEPVTLSWVIENAPGGMQIVDPIGQVLTTTTSTAGAVTFYPEESGDFTLTARNASLGDASSSIAITVIPRAPAIVEFTPSTTQAAIASLVQLTYDALGADTVRITDALGGIVYEGTAARGTVDAQIGLEDATFELEATNNIGTTRQTVTVRAFGPPRITSFALNPHFTQLSAATVNLVWVSEDAEDVELFVDGVSVTIGTIVPRHNAVIGIGAGNTPYATVGPTVFELAVRNPAGTVVERRYLGYLTPEPEPNDTMAQAVVLAGDGTGTMGSISVAADVDWYSVQVPDGWSVFAETSDGSLMGACIIDTLLELYDSAGNLIDYDDDTGAQVFNVAGCSILDGHYDPAVRNLPGGTYYFKIYTYPNSSFLTTTSGSYSFTVTLTPPGCGDGIIQPGEQCDDRNVIHGDGCSSTCQDEMIRRFTGPGRTWTIPSSVISTQVDWYQIDLASPGYLRAETWVPAIGLCNGADSILRLWDSNFVEIASDDDSGVYSCSKLDTSLSPALAAGTHYLTVEDKNIDEPFDYVLSIDLIAPGCGNGILGDGIEECDDGNSTPGDGCSPACTFEGRSEAEALGNETRSGAGVTTSSSDEVLEGRIGGSRDVDWYAIVVPAGNHLDAYVTVQSLADCPATGPATRLSLFDASGTQLAVNSSDGPNVTCGRISPETTDAAFAMAAGTYYVRVDVVDGTAVVPRYYLHVQLIAPECGNGYLDGAEECDDGNIGSLDGCSLACTYELGTLPGGTATLDFTSGGVVRILPVVTTLAGQSITAQALDTNGTTCNSVDTRIELRDSNFELLGSVSGGGPSGSVGTCAAIDPAIDHFATDLAVGTYYVFVSAETSAGGMVRADVSVDDPECSNAIIEERSGEQCDDGNLANNDGCSSSCRLEPSGTLTLPTTAPAVFSGAVAPAGTRTAYRLTVSGGTPVLLSAQTFAPTRTAGCNADTVLRLYDATGAEVGGDDEGGTGSCSRIVPTQTFAQLAPGVYTLTVGDYQDDESISAYELVIEARVINVCGNGLRENAETCDDGNTLPGDGCAPGCALEGTLPLPEVEPNGGPGAAAQLLGTISAPQIVEVAAQITPGGDEDWYSFTLPGTEHVSALITVHSAVGNLASCGIDPEVWLYDAIPTDLIAESSLIEPAIVGYDNNDGAGLCAQLAGTDLVPVPIDLLAGTYYLRVRGFRGVAAIPQYYVTIDLR